MALDAGHTVSVLVRSPSKLPQSIASRVTVYTMPSLTDEAALERALKGQEVVLCVIGPRLFFHANGTPIAKGFEVLTKKMAESQSVKRFIVQSTLSDVDAKDRLSLFGWLLPELVWAFAHPAWRDIIEMGKVVRASTGFEWIIVRVALLTSLIDGSKVGQGYVGEGGEKSVPLSFQALSFADGRLGTWCRGRTLPVSCSTT